MASRFIRQTFYSCLLIALPGLTVFGQRMQKTEARELRPSQTFTREINRSETHRYKFSLKKSEFFQVRVELLGINLSLKLVDARGNTMTRMNSPSNTKGYEILSFVAPDDGSFVLEVSDTMTTVQKGSYILKREAARVASAKDKRQVEVERLFMEGINAGVSMEPYIKKLTEALAGWQELEDRYMEELTAQKIQEAEAREYFLTAKGLLDQGTMESYRAALPKFKEASRLYKEKGNKLAAVAAILGAGVAHEYLGERHSALESFKQALPLVQSVGDRHHEAAILSSIGQLHLALGDKTVALDYLNQALLLNRELKSQLKEAQTMFSIGVVYQASGERQKALDIFNQALPTLNAFGDKNSESYTRNLMGVIYFEFGEYQKALHFYKQALSISKRISKCAEAGTLTNIAEVYNVLGEKALALDILIKQALPLYKQERGCRAEPSTLNNTGKVYYELGENQKALEYCHRALFFFRAFRDKIAEAATLMNLGNAYHASGRSQEALKFYTQSLDAYKALGDRKSEATVLTNIGVVQVTSGKNDEALDFFNKALSIRRTIGDKNGEAITLNNIGEIYLTSGESAKALESINQALPLFRAAGDRIGEAILLGNAMLVWESPKNRRLAVFYGKQSVNKLQRLRSATRGLDNETQKSFLRNIQHAYQKLAELLIMENQFEQAVQVLNLYQDQQFFDFNHGSTSPVRQIVLSAREREFSRNYEMAGERIRQVGLQSEEFHRQIANSQTGEQQTTALQPLKAKVQTAVESFSDVLKQAEKEFARPQDEKDKIPAVREVSDMQKALDMIGKATKQKTVTLHTLIGADKFYILMVTPDGGIKAFQSPIKSADLNKKILEFHALLQSPVYDPRPLGKELYNFIFKPVEEELQKTGAQVLMWQLDGNLRYIPVAALWDGEKYLVERYQNVAFTRADIGRVLQTVSRDWSGTGFGNSQEAKVDLFNDGKNMIPFSALSGVTRELAAIFKTQPASNAGILKGEVFSDKAFTKAAFFNAMRARRPLVHIASHFRFYPGDSSLSFLLLGDGKALTLNEMKKEERLFEGVELLTLSACNTAATLADAAGREIDGFAEMAQRLGASAVLATLWQVSDASTPWLMSEFYHTKKVIPGITKSEALRKAQRALLNGTADTRLFSDAPRSSGTSNIKVIIVSNSEKQPRDMARSDVVYVSEKDAPLYKTDERKPFAHPYYWSAFVLFGNWR